MADSNTNSIITVIICSCDRIGQLRDCLESLVRAGAHFHREWELIIVDNSSNATLKQLLQSDTRYKDLPLRVIWEPIAGLARARNRGLQHSIGSVIAFTDDDCLVDKNWLQDIYEVFENTSDLALLGGRVDSAEGASATISVRPFGQNRTIDTLSCIEHYLIGCNFAVRRSVMQTTGEFDVCLGAGTPAFAAEDLDYFYRVFLNGGKIQYHANCCVTHVHGRSSPQDIRNISSNYIFGRGFWYAKRILKQDRIFLRYFYWELRNFTPVSMKLTFLRGLLCGLINYAFRCPERRLN